jgi:hypothetical protein
MVEMELDPISSIAILITRAYTAGEACAMNARLLERAEASSTRSTSEAART